MRLIGLEVKVQHQLLKGVLQLFLHIQITKLTSSTLSIQMHSFTIISVRVGLSLYYNLLSWHARSHMKNWSLFHCLKQVEYYTVPVK